MEVKLFKASNGTITNSNFQDHIDKFDLEGKDVLIYSRLLSFGRLLGKNAVESILSILKKAVGEKGTLIIPTSIILMNRLEYLMKLNEDHVRCFGEFTTSDKDFTRTIHPIYSNAIYGNNKQYYKMQNELTYFGEEFF